MYTHISKFNIHRLDNKGPFEKFSLFLLFFCVRRTIIERRGKQRHFSGFWGKRKNLWQALYMSHKFLT